jgi:hypothetical protein
MKQKTGIPMRGLLWKTCGFTRIHIWGVNIVGGIVIAVGSAAATVATMGIVFLPDHFFWRCVAVSVCASLICIAMALASIFTLTFYAGANNLRLTEDTKETAESSLQA